MFMDAIKFTVRMNLVVDWFVALQCKTIQYLFIHLLGDLFVGEGNHKIDKHWPPMNSNDSTVIFLKKSLFILA